AFLGRQISSLGLSEEIIQNAISNFRKAIVSKKVAVFRFATGIRARKFHFETTVHPDFDTEGELISLTAVTQDITALVQQDDKIARKDAHKELLLELSQEYMHADEENVSSIIQNTLA